MEFVLRGIPVKITWHFFALITFMLSLKTQNVLYAVLFSLLHETGHLCAMLAFGFLPREVAFELTGMNIKRNENTGISLAKEMAIAFAGPLVNLILSLCFVLVFLQTEKSKYLDMTSVNLILSVFNLMPIKGLDGGKLLYYFLSKAFSFKAAHITLHITSAVFIFVLIFYGIYVLYVTKYNFTVLIIALSLSLSMFSPEEC